MAATAMLDKEYLILLLINLKNINSYLFSRISNYNVVIACLPAKTISKVLATIITINLIYSFLLI